MPKFIRLTEDRRHIWINPTHIVSMQLWYPEPEEPLYVPTASGTIVTLIGGNPDYPLRVDQSVDDIFDQIEAFG